MKLFTYLAIILMASSLCWGETVTNLYYDAQTMQQNTIVFTYGTNQYETISGIPHYPATITVYRKFNGEQRKISSFPGFYTEHKCWEDSLPDIVRKAEYDQYTLPYVHGENK